MVAVGHSILIATWHMITSDTECRGLGGDFFIERTGKTRVTQRLVTQLSQLGWRVNLTDHSLTDHARPLVPAPPGQR